MGLSETPFEEGIKSLRNQDKMIFHVIFFKIKINVGTGGSVSWASESWFWLQS